ncbi:hypothetical protein [Anatilimnocola floriformis]|uniref:hypothetical protein n=1 Tax=Anatilimnocola floriformis TaxID=2948575 RepID=UPI0020C3231D|nr:hypothetical protein [Anatilimnocola floriformis]
MPPVAYDFRRWLMLWVGCCAAVLAMEPAGAQEPLQVESATVGFGGVYKAGYWTQILVEVKAGSAGASGRLSLLTEDGDGVPVIFPAELDEQLELGPGEKKTVRLYGKAGPERSLWQLQLMTTEGTPQWSTRLDVPQPQRSTRELLVTIGPAPGVAVAAGLVKRPLEVAYVVGAVENVRELPDRVWGYEGVERVVLFVGEKSIFEELSAQQLETLHQWVRLGGKLLISIGERAPELLQPDLPWAKLIPGKFAGLDPLRATGQLKEAGEAEFPNITAAERRPQVVKLAELTGRVEVQQGGGNPPLAYRQAYGFGEVTFVAIALDHPTLLEWKGHTKFLMPLLQVGSPKPENLAAARNRSITHLGYDDLTGQLRAVLDHFPGVTVVSFTAVAMVAVALLLLIGPVDFFFLQHFNLPRTVTWFTFPAICLGVAAGTWYLSQLAHGTATRVNQVELVDIDAAQGIVRGTLWSHLYSPQGRTWQMSLQVAERNKSWKEIDGVADWQGLPGSGLGGLASPQVALDTTNPYLISPPGKTALIDSLPIRTASSKALAGRWWSQTDIAKDLPRLETNQYGHLEGTIVNPLPVKLTECHVTSGEWLYRIDELEPKQEIKASSLIPLNLESRLTRRTVVDTKDLSTPWKSDDTDLPRIMQMLMLHNAVKGPTYTGMSHRYQPQLDLSEHLRLSRAILIGRAEVPAAALQLQDVPAGELQQQQWIWYRFVLPVQPRDAAAQPNSNSAPATQP